MSDERGEPSEPTRALPSDGTIDFTKYTDSQLGDLQHTLDRARFPENFRNLLAEMQRRAASPVTPTSQPELFHGRFTAEDGLRGWLEAWAGRSPLYGTGYIEIKGTEVVCNGWQRTWLGTALQAEVGFEFNRVRNVTEDSGVVHFEVSARYRPTKRLTFRAESPSAAQQLATQLPRNMSSGFEQRWREIRAFNARLRSVSRTPWVTPAIVAVNCLVFAVMCAATKQLGNFSLITLTNWGANFGPLTVNGGWWRLLSAVFVHLNLWHLLLNMWALWNVGRLCERIFGRFNLVLLYFFGGVLASLSSIAWNPNLSSVGASGAIFALIGAFLAFYLNPNNRVPRTVARRHWISTSAFALFNLISGAVQPGIDNAAHVGGLLAGFGLGWLLARPLDTGSRKPLSGTRYAAAATLVVFLTVAAIWQVKGIGSKLTVPEQYIRQHQDYVRAETQNMQLWNELSAKASAGTISDLEFGERFEREIVPFWQSALATMNRENQTLQGAQRSFGLLVADFVKYRGEWAETIVEAIKENDQTKTADIKALVLKTNLAQARLTRVILRAQMDHRPRALANNAVVSKIRRLLSGYRWKCIEGQPETWRSVHVASDDQQDGPAARHEVACLAQELFMQADYRRLDSLMDRYQRSLGDLPDGSSHYEAIIVGLHTLFSSGTETTQALLGQTADWRRSARNSSRPDLLEALIFQASAWAARGQGSADSVSTQAWSQFAFGTEMAAESLKATQERAATDPAWYQISLDVGLDQDVGVENLRKLFDEGATQFPAYRPLERSMLRALMPRWRGSYADVDKFVNAIYQQTESTRGFERYAELYTEYSDLERDDVDLFSGTEAYWSGMRSGFAGLIIRYPHSDAVLNRFANFACRAGDIDQYQILRRSLNKRYSSIAWSTKYSLDSCDKTFAKMAASRPAPAAQSANSAGAQFLALSAIRLGMTSQELLAAKGRPVSQNPNYWIYNSVDSRHNGVLTAMFSTPTPSADARVVAIEFTGDRESSPAELPYLNGLAEGDLRAELGGMIGMASPSETVTRYMFRNGVYADARNGRVFQYGIYSVTPPK